MRHPSTAHDPGHDPDQATGTTGARRGRLLLAATASVLLGGFMIHNSLGAPTGPPPQPAAAGLSVSSPPAASGAVGSPGTTSATKAPLTSPAPLPSGGASASPAPAHATVQPLKRSRPVRIRIPGLGVDAPFTGVSVDSKGTLGVPPTSHRNLAGWYRDGAAPGSAGSAIVVGHVDTLAGPAVFYGLGSMKPGDTVDITRADGIVARFAVDSVEIFPKNDFPDERVYKDTPDPQLRLITCGGTYDKKARDYTANVVVFARLVSSSSS